MSSSAAPVAFLHPAAQMCRLARSLPPGQPCASRPWLPQPAHSPREQRGVQRHRQYGQSYPQCPLAGRSARHGLLTGNIPGTTSSLIQAQRREVS